MSNLPEMWVPPSAEHRWLYRHVRWLVAPPQGQGSLVARLLRAAMVAPMTQLTFVSFDMQCFFVPDFPLDLGRKAGSLVRHDQ